MASLAERFPGRRAFVTGAGSGLGRALAARLASEGWTLGIQDLNGPAADETLGQVQAAGGRGRTFVYDVSRADATEAAAREFLAENGGIDVVFNNAGVAVGGAIEQVPLLDWEWIVGVNLWGPVHGCRAFLPAMRAQRSGHLVNVASLAGLLFPPGTGPYNVTKSSVVALSETLRNELLGTGVGVSLVCPSFFPTHLAESSRADAVVRGKVQHLMDRGEMTAEQVARVVLESVASGRFYILPQRDARFFWRMKRLSPLLDPGVSKSLSRVFRRRTRRG
jgi:NAD(P)-dependent dehydrogenase (short-subunit alcohol dehydrogenase family)